MANGLKTILLHCPNISQLEPVTQSALEDALAHALEYGENLEEGCNNQAHLYFLADVMHEEGLGYPPEGYSDVDEEDVLFRQQADKMLATIGTIAKLNRTAIDSFNNDHSYKRPSFELKGRFNHSWLITVEELYDPKEPPIPF